MQFSLIIFDLDNTLLHTDALEDYRGKDNVGEQDDLYVKRLVKAASDIPSCEIYSSTFLKAVAHRHPELRFGVFTRSPSCYARTLLDLFYHDFEWDVIIAFENVRYTKPNPEGINRAMELLGIDERENVLLVGDSKADVIAAYNGGVWSLIDKSSWRRPYVTDNYQVMERLPDGIIDSPMGFLNFIEAPYDNALLMEKYCFYKGVHPPSPLGRFECVKHFFSNDNETDWVSVYLLGRRFKAIEALESRRSWHAISHEIEGNKNSDVFPVNWIYAIRGFIAQNWHVERGLDIVVTVIPAKPNRFPRLEKLLEQLERSHNVSPISDISTIVFDSNVFSYLDGARSHHGEKLSGPDRMSNVIENLVMHPEFIKKSKTYIVFDDVITTGATLYWAHKLLSNADVKNVRLASLTKAISEK